MSEPRHARAIARPLRVYALLELVVAFVERFAPTAPGEQSGRSR